MLNCGAAPVLMLDPSLAAEVPAQGANAAPEGPTLPEATRALALSLRGTPALHSIDLIDARERSESDAYIDTAIAASTAVLTSVDGGEKDPLAPETIADLALRASAASVSTAANVALLRQGADGLGSLDMAALWVREQGGGVVFTLRF